MDSAEQPRPGGHTYLGDPENAAEMARLLLQDQLVTSGMGGVLAEQTALSSWQRVLDIACGPGGWASGLAKQYPHLSVTGVDVSQQMINFAQVQAHREGIGNVHFEVMNVLEPLTFPDEYFDLVNMRFALGFLRRSSWPVVLQECFRITRPGGVVRLTEADQGSISNSAACDDVNRLLAEMFYRAGYGFSASGANHMITPMLGKLLMDAGYRSIQYVPHVIDLSYGSPHHAPHFQNLCVIIKQSEPILIKMGLAKPEEMARIYNAVTHDLQQKDFRGLSYFVTCRAEKSASADA